MGRARAITQGGRGPPTNQNSGIPWWAKYKLHRKQDKQIPVRKLYGYNPLEFGLPLGYRKPPSWSFMVGL